MEQQVELTPPRAFCTFLCVAVLLLPSFAGTFARTAEAVIVVGLDAPVAFVGYEEFDWPIHSNLWSFQNSLVRWIVHARVDGRAVGQPKRLRILVVGPQNDFELPIADTQGFCMQLYLHLTDAGHRVETASVGMLAGMSARELNAYDLVYYTPLFGSGAVERLREAGVAYITHSRPDAEEFGLVGNRIRSSRSPLAIVPQGSGPFANLATGIVRPRLPEPRHVLVELGPHGEPALLEYSVPETPSIGLQTPGERSAPSETEQPWWNQHVGSTDEKAFVIVSRTAPHAFFGFYRAWQLDSDAWCYLQTLIDWLSGSERPCHCQDSGRDCTAAHEGMKILVFGYSNDFVLGVESLQLSAFLVATQLHRLGYEVHTRGQLEFESTTVEEFREYDLVLYYAPYAYSPHAVIASGVPFITILTQHAISLGIADAAGAGYLISETLCVDDDEGPYARYPQGIGPLHPAVLGGPRGLVMHPTPRGRGLIWPTCPPAPDAKRSAARPRWR